ncbi:hypothetical protein C8J56DRAFT_788098, partial [Mycena floridula]
QSLMMTPSASSTTMAASNLKMPEHWRVDSPILSSIFSFLAVISFGHHDLQYVWDRSNAGETTWTECKDRVSSRITTITIVGGLLLAATAAFATTTPPAPHMLDYLQRSSYICIVFSFGFSLGGEIVGSCLVYVITRCTSHWFLGTLMASHSRVICTLILVAYPFVITGMSVSLFALGSATSLAKVSSLMVDEQDFSLLPGIPKTSLSVGDVLPFWYFQLRSCSPLGGLKLFVSSAISIWSLPLMSGELLFADGQRLAC